MPSSDRAQPSDLYPHYFLYRRFNMVSHSWTPPPEAENPLPHLRIRRRSGRERRCLDLLYHSKISSARFSHHVGRSKLSR